MIHGCTCHTTSGFNHFVDPTQPDNHLTVCISDFFPLRVNQRSYFNACRTRGQPYVLIVYHACGSDLFLQLLFLSCQELSKSSHRDDIRFNVLIYNLSNTLIVDATLDDIDLFSELKVLQEILPKEKKTANDILNLSRI